MAFFQIHRKQITYRLFSTMKVCTLQFIFGQDYLLGLRNYLGTK